MNKQTKDCINYGLLSVAVFMLLTLLLSLISSVNKGVHLTYVLRIDGEDNGVLWFLFFMTIWIFISFGIGYFARRNFIVEKAFYRKQVFEADTSDFNKGFKQYYLSQKAKMLLPVFIIAIPIYLIAYVNDGLKPLDIVLVLALASSALVCLLFYRRYK